MRLIPTIIHVYKRHLWRMDSKHYWLLSSTLKIKIYEICYVQSMIRFSGQHVQIYTLRVIRIGLSVE